MKIYSFIFCLFIALNQKSLAQTNIKSSDRKKDKNGKPAMKYPNFDHSLLLESKSDTTANVSFGDFNRDSNLDILLVKGRHWPIVDRILLGDGFGGILKTYDLGKIADRSYTGCLADFNADGFLDIAVSNDAPDRKLIYFNDGKGNFAIGSEFGIPGWPTRNLATADINNDGLTDLILANRGNASTSNFICLNQGEGQFNSSCTAFARYPATTITPADFNKDGFIDLVVPHRNGGQSFIYIGSKDYTFTDLLRIPFGPSDATIRGSVVADFTSDTILDIVTIDENKGVTLYIGHKDQTFHAGISLADSKIIPYALTIADLNSDNRPDIIVGHVEAPSTVFFNEGTGNTFKPISFGDSKGTVYGFAIGDFNKDGIQDIAAARSEATNIIYFGNIKLK